MSIESWIQEFYPVPASKDHSDIEAIEHGIKKWKGYSEKNLKKHDLSREGAMIYEDTAELDEDTAELDTDFIFSVDTCSLCLKYFSKKCDECPLTKINKGCLSSQCNGDFSQYTKTLHSGDPKFILNALKKALVFVKENS